MSIIIVTSIIYVLLGFFVVGVSWELDPPELTKYDMFSVLVAILFVVTTWLFIAIIYFGRICCRYKKQRSNV